MNQNNQGPLPYVISIPKLVILSVLTFGIFDWYWFYRQWKSFAKDRHNFLVFILLAIFAVLSCFSLFPNISGRLKDNRLKVEVSPIILALLYFLLTGLDKLPTPFFLLSSATVIPLAFVQKEINTYSELKYGDKLIQSNFGIRNLITSIIGGIVMFLILYASLFLKK